MSFHLGIGTGFGLLVAGMMTGISWAFDVQPEENHMALAAAGAVLVVVAIMLEWRKRLGERP